MNYAGGALACLAVPFPKRTGQVVFHNWRLAACPTPDRHRGSAITPTMPALNTKYMHTFELEGRSGDTALARRTTREGGGATDRNGCADSGD